MFDNLKNLIRHKANTNHSTTGRGSPVSTTGTTSDDLLHAQSSNTTSPSIEMTKDKHTEPLPVYKELSPRYEIVEKLGDGAFSKVFKAVDHSSDSFVAIKVIDKTSMSSAQIENVFKEISIMRRLAHHPNVVKLHNYINGSKLTFLIIEYVSGGELFNQIVKYTYFSEDLSRHIIVQVVKAVDYLHSEVGVVHRDIKPENILFEEIEFFPLKDSDQIKRRKSDDANKLDEGEFKPNIGGAKIGNVKIADFGLSKILWDSNTKTPCGTASYTAPEIVKDEAYSKSVDMWAIGCVLYTLLCGFPPFYDTDPKVLTQKVAKGEYTFLSPWWDEISKEAKDLVSHLLTVDPLKRYGPDDVLNHPWILNNSEPTLPARDAPVYKTKNESILRFEETIPTIKQFGNVNTLSPRAEALKFAFDTGMSIQRTGTPMKLLDDEYFNESDDEDSDDDYDDDDDDDDDLDSDDEEETYTSHTIYTNSPVLKKFPKGIITPNHCSRRTPVSSSKYQTSSTSRLSNIVPSSLEEPAQKRKSVHSVISNTPSSSTDLSMVLEKRSSSDVQFKNIEGFSLSFDGNTLLNRRKMSGAAPGPLVT